MSQQPPRIHFEESVVVDQMPEGAACAELPPDVAVKYFTSNESWEVRTAKAICGHCPVQAMCLERAINGPPTYRGKFCLIPGVRGGMTAHKIHLIQSWERYDRGLGRKPKVPRVERYRAPVKQLLPVGPSVARIADLSFEERVYLIFRDAKDGRYPNLNAAIADIAALHSAVLVQGQKGKGYGRIVAGTHEDGRRNPRRAAV